MLRGISPLIAPELLMILSEMGHGETMLLADANFPAGKYCRRVLHAPGVDITQLLAAIMPLWVLDYKCPPLAMPSSNNGCDNTPLASEYLGIIRGSIPAAPEIEFIDGEDFYRRAGETRVAVVTGDLHRFANLIVRKGVFTPELLAPREK